MKYTDLEKKLSDKHKKRRIVLGVLAVLFIILCFCSVNLREASKETIIHGEPPFTWETTKYNDNYLILLIPGIFGSLICVNFFIADLGCRHATIEKDGHYITVYRGMVSCAVFVDGEQEGEILPFSYDHVVEFVLPSRVKVIVNFPHGKVLWTLAHIAFSDNTQSIDL